MFACEWDKMACASYRLNFPKTPLYEGDIAALTVDEVLSTIKLQPGQLDIFDGSPPCQGFSTAGKRKLDDPRNQLFNEYARLLKGLQPRVFVMENVAGMVKGKMKLVFVECFEALKACGYWVRAKVLNAKYFDVPQSRQRLIFIGVRKDQACKAEYPEPRLPVRTAGDAVAGLKLDQSEREWLLAMGRKHASFKHWYKLRPGQSNEKVAGSGFNAVKCRPEKPCQTIRRNDGNIGMHGWMHWAECRRFTVGEAKRFSTFPDDFEFAGEWADAVRQIGNAVPPNFMRAIATCVRDNILQRPTKATREKGKA